MSTIATLVVQLIGDASGYSNAMKEGEETTQKFGASITDDIDNLLDFAAVAEIAKEGAKMITEVLKESIIAAADEETALSRLNMTIESTGRLGEISAAGLDKMAASPLFDTAQLNEAANTLMRFMDIPSSQIGPDMQVIENMAIALGQTLPQAAQTFGMAMETGRTRGLGFSRELTTQITQLMAAGQVQEADAIILDQLSQKYSGQASAALDTYNGKVTSLKTAWEEEEAASGKAFIQNSVVRNSMDTLTHAIETSTDRLDLLNQARDEGINAMVHEGTATVQVNGAVMTYDGLLELVKEHEQEVVDITQQHTSHLAGLAAAMSDAYYVTDMFTGAQLEETMAFKQEGDELNFILNYAKSYETNLKNVSDAEEKVSQDENDLAALQKAGWGSTSAKIKDAQTALENAQQALINVKNSAKVATDEMIAGFLQAQLAADGVLSQNDIQKILDYRLAVGLLTTDEYNAALQAMDLAEQIANLPANTILNLHLNLDYSGAMSLADIAKLTGGGGTIGTTVSGKTGKVIPPPVTPAYMSPGQTAKVTGASGLNMTIPPGFDHDDYPIFVSSGEHAIVIPKGIASNNTMSGGGAAGQAGGGDTYNYNVTLYYPEPEKASNAIPQALRNMSYLNGVKK